MSGPGFEPNDLVLPLLTRSLDRHPGVQPSPSTFVRPSRTPSQVELRPTSIGNGSRVGTTDLGNVMPAG